MFVFFIVGLLDKVVFEVCECICVVMNVLFIVLFLKCIMVNLLLVDLFKEGSYFDLFIVIVFLVVLDIIFKEVVEMILVFGELFLDGMFIFVIGVFFVVMIVVCEDCCLFCFVVLGLEVVWVGVIEVIVL